MFAESRVIGHCSFERWAAHHVKAGWTCWITMAVRQVQWEGLETRVGRGLLPGLFQIKLVRH